MATTRLIDQMSEWSDTLARVSRPGRVGPAERRALDRVRDGIKEAVSEAQKTATAKRKATTTKG